jgi:hypothetical protein
VTLTRTYVTLLGRVVHTHAEAEAPDYCEGAAHRLTQPVCIGFEPSSTLKGVLALVHFVTPLRLACRARTIR